MTQQLLRELIGFARQSGYGAAPCPSCRDRALPGAGSSACGNCGGSGRLWASARGTLSDDGLQRLRRMIACGGGAEQRS